MQGRPGSLARTYLVATELRLYSTLFSDAYACGGSGHYSRPVDPRGLDPSYTAQTSIGAILHPAQAQLNSITKILTHAQNDGVDSEQWQPPVDSSVNLASAAAGCLQYSAVYVPTTNNLVGESSFSTTSTSDQALPSAHSSQYHSSRSSSGTGGGRSHRKNTSRCHTHRRSRQPPPTTAAASSSNNTRTISSSCSCSSCSSSCPEDKENNSQICSSPPLPLSSNVMASAVSVMQATVNGQESDLLWQQGGHHLALCTMASMQNNLPVASSNGGFAYSASAALAPAPTSNADVQSRQSWHKNVVVQQAEENGSNGIFSSLWRKRSRTTQNQRLANNKRNPRSPMHAASASTATEASASSITKTGNQQHAWMTLCVPTTGAGHLENMHQPQQQPLSGNVPVGFRLHPQQPHSGGQPLPAAAMMAVQSSGSKTLGRQPSNNNNNVNGHTVMPNPDDILPKEAWTDFSGNDEWPRFSRIAGSAAAASTDRNTASTMASVTDNNNSIGTRLYVNCPATSSSSSSNGRVVRGLRPDSKNDGDDQDAANGNCENSLAGGGGSSALNGLRPSSAIAATTVLTSPTRTTRTVDNDDNGGQQQMSQWNEKFSQQIENNLMASVSSTPLREHRDTRRDSKKPVLVGASVDSSCSLGSCVDGGSQGHVRGSSEMRSKPPVPPPRNCISHQRKTRTKKQQSKGNGATGLHYLASEEAIGAGDGSRGGHHANDEKSSISSAASAASMAEADDSQDESDNDLEEKSLLFQPDSISEWHQSPLLQ